MPNATVRTIAALGLATSLAACAQPPAADSGCSCGCMASDASVATQDAAADVDGATAEPDEGVVDRDAGVAITDASVALDAGENDASNAAVSDAGEDDASDAAGLDAVDGVAHDASASDAGADARDASAHDAGSPDATTSDATAPSDVAAPDASSAADAGEPLDCSAVLTVGALRPADCAFRDHVSYHAGRLRWHCGGGAASLDLGDDIVLDGTVTGTQVDVTLCHDDPAATLDGHFERVTVSGDLSLGTLPLTYERDTGLACDRSASDCVADAPVTVR